MKLRYITPLLAATAAVASIAVAPVALASSTTSQQTCAQISGTDTQCQTPGNVQINDSPPVQFTPQYPYWEGDWYGGYVHGSGGHR